MTTQTPEALKADALVVASDSSSILALDSILFLRPDNARSMALPDILRPAEMKAELYTVGCEPAQGEMEFFLTSHLNSRLNRCGLVLGRTAVYLPDLTDPRLGNPESRIDALKAELHVSSRFSLLAVVVPKTGAGNYHNADTIAGIPLMCR